MSALIVLSIAASCVFPTQELGGSLQGECTNFQAVAGRGLHCVVSGVERYAVKEGESSETLTRHLYSSTEVSLVPSNIQDLVGTAHLQKKYKVSTTTAIEQVLVCCMYILILFQTAKLTCIIAYSVQSLCPDFQLKRDFRRHLSNISKGMSVLGGPPLPISDVCCQNMGSLCDSPV